MSLGEGRDRGAGDEIPGRGNVRRNEALLH